MLLTVPDATVQLLTTAMDNAVVVGLQQSDEVSDCLRLTVDMTHCQGKGPALSLNLCTSYRQKTLLKEHAVQSEEPGHGLSLIHI